ncbi:MAG: hypothetical protein EXR84_14080 [Gammaproteobacteria bacterium]|nr:hypothetical protein [Gammaproteobacteria bacterium]
MNNSDAITLAVLRGEYLADAYVEEDVITTSAMQLQDDAYALGYKRAANGLDDARKVLEKIMQHHVTALPKATRAEIESVIGVTV